MDEPQLLSALLVFRREISAILETWGPELESTPILPPGFVQRGQAIGSWASSRGIETRGLFSMLALFHDATPQRWRPEDTRAAWADCQRELEIVELAARGPTVLATPANEPATPNTPHVESKHPRAWLAEAMLLVRDHPRWSDRKIAGKVHKSHTTLLRCQEYRLAAAMARGSKADRPAGFVTKSEGGLSDVEAVAPATATLDDQSDRGQPIHGSRFFREYCSECGEPMKVSRSQVGQNPLCQRCE